MRPPSAIVSIALILAHLDRSERSDGERNYAVTSSATVHKSRLCAARGRASGMRVRVTRELERGVGRDKIVG
jgi:hypothetical protein